MKKTQIYHEELTKAMNLVNSLNKMAESIASFNKDNGLTSNTDLSVLDSGLMVNYILPQFEMAIEGRHKNFFVEDKFGNVTLYNYVDMKITETGNDDDAIRMINVIKMGNKKDKSFGLIDPFHNEFTVFDDVIVDIVTKHNEDDSFVYGYFVNENEPDTRII